MKENRCKCGFPLSEIDRMCVACLPPQLRMATGRYNFSIVESLLKSSA